MQTDLVMFNCRETTLFDLLEPRSFAYMTKIHLFDGRRDAPPEHYWYSRIDTRDSIISSIYTEPGTRLKLTLSDTVLTRKMILTNSSEEKRLWSWLSGRSISRPSPTPPITRQRMPGHSSIHGSTTWKTTASTTHASTICKTRGLAALATSSEGYQNL